MTLLGLLSSVWRSMLVILVTAIVLGLAHNSLSPLGVRSRPKTLPPAQVARSNPRVSNPPVPSLYSNQVVSLRIESLPGRIVPDTITERTLPPVAPQSSLPSLPSLTWPQTKALLASNLVVLVDTRSAAAFEAEHIPGAVSLPSNASAEQWARFKELYPPATPLVLYCSGAPCPVALRLADVLMKEYAYRNIRHLPGGFAEFRLAQQLAAGVKPAPAK